MSTKHVTQMKVLRALFRLEIAQGHLKWTVAQLARASKVSRVTIYLYFGNNKKTILENAVHLVCQEYFGLTEERMTLAKLDFAASASRTRAMFDQTPEFGVFYQVHRAGNSPFKDILVHYENEYRKKLKKLWPSLSYPETVLLHACLHGLVTAPFLVPGDFGDAITGLLKVFRPLK